MEAKKAAEQGAEKVKARIDNTEKNVGKVDSYARIGVGGALIFLALFSGAPGAMVGWIGVIPLATGVLRICPFYKMTGMNTCEPASK
ncbi:DUF2892 domain-containing protein [uncultured Rhodospira sp.]|uniref:YgaP family membrane protein n=1 Tax=uncultured Rhodospira sp. TaxID=1936189 RepID=UPI002614A2ED|nr:DUF2892 domain-containing protein [uncultured Rhodospira sp.]